MVVFVRITMYMLREGIQPSQDLLRRGERYDEVALIPSPDPGMTWQLYTFRSPPTPVRWAGDLRSVMTDPASLDLRSQSSGAVLLAGIEGRTFALTFGTGFHAVDPQHYEPDFGLKVAANSVDPTKIKSAEARGLGKGSRNAVSSLPVPNRLFALRLATNEEWIRRMGGQVLDSDFAVSVSGADSLRLSLDDVTLSDLPTVLRRVLELFGSNAYREYLPQLDQFRRLSGTHPRIPELDSLVLGELRDRAPDIGFAAPDELHFYNVDRFLLRRRRRTYELSDLSTEGVYSALDALDAWGDPMESVKVVAYSDDQALGPPRPLHQYVVADVSPDGETQRYVLTAGAWFSIAATYARYLDEVLDRVEDATDRYQLPTWDAEWLAANVEGSYGEERYNRHVATADGRVLMDRSFFYGPAGERVEVCDILTRTKDLLCVKRLDGSDNMIHLFEQGQISVTLLKKNPEYRDFVLEKLDEAGGGTDYGNEDDWTVVFAIATSRPGPIKTLLPFFARASLAANLDAITDKGFRVALAKIDMA